MNDLTHVIQRVIDAHGGSALWQRISSIEAVISVNGLLFATKRVKPLQAVRISASTITPAMTLFDYPKAGQRGEWLGEDEVRIIADDGTMLAQRIKPRSAFGGIRRELWWDELDFLFFASYAIWNYLCTPFVFLHPGFTFKRLPAVIDRSICLEATFPPEVPSHCRQQIFHFAQEGELLRLDYTAEVVGHWAKAAHLCQNYRNFEGLRAPTHRRVHPLFGLKNPLPFPTLVAINVHEMRPVFL